MLNSERFRERLRAANLSQLQLAQRSGVNQGTIAKLANGKARGSSQFHRIARELGTTADYLMGNTDSVDMPPAVIPTTDELADSFDTVMVPLFDLDFAMGDGTFFDQAAVPELIRSKKHGCASIS